MKTISGFGRRLCIKTKAIRLRAVCTRSLLPLLLVLLLPAVVQAQFSYTINDGTITITGYGGPGGAVTIPSTINGLPVSAIEAYVPSNGPPVGAFAGCESLTSVTIPGSVTYLGRYAFMGCLNLTSVYFEGNAPSVGWIEVFNWPDGYTTNGLPVWEADPATVYYLPGTTGWGTEFSVLRTALWLPQVLTSDASFGVQANQFGFTISWASGMTVVIEACTNPVNPVWSPIQTNTLNGNLLYFSDPNWTNYPSRFYRVTWP